jgi:hypothetical protein
MSLDALLKRLAGPTSAPVPTVPAGPQGQGTGQPHTEQTSSPSSPSSPDHQEAPSTRAEAASSLEPRPPLAAAAEQAIRAWLAQIAETDPIIIAEVLDRCRRDARARAYFLQRAAEYPSAVTPAGLQPP